MKTYTLPEIDLPVSRIAYGCMNLGKPWQRQPLTSAERKDAARVVTAALGQGINLFDHADIYAFGRSEEAFGAILRQAPELRDKMVLQSKCGIRFQGDPNADSPARYDSSYEHIIRSVEGSLRRLQTDYLDILLLHRPDPLLQPEEVARAFADLRESGKVRAFGVSNYGAAQIELLCRALDVPLIVNQVQLSLLHAHLINESVLANGAGGEPSAAEGTLDTCRLLDMRVQAWAPLAGGRLCGAPARAGKRVKQTLACIEKMAEAKNTSQSAIALAWLLAHPAGIQPIIGSTKPERIEASCLADKVTLSREEWYALFIAGCGAPLP